jgi:signal peptidase II
MAHRVLPFLLAIALVAADQATKAWVVAEVAIGERAASWFGFVHLTHTRNTGAAFGLLRDLRIDLGAVVIDGVQVLGLISLVVALAVTVVLLRARSLGPLNLIALGTLLGGAVGNGVDRLRLGYVTDFIQLQAGWFDFPVFNVADMAIVAGAGLLVLSTLLHPGAARER